MRYDRTNAPNSNVRAGETTYYAPGKLILHEMQRWCYGLNDGKTAVLGWHLCSRYTTSLNAGRLTLKLIRDEANGRGHSHAGQVILSVQVGDLCGTPIIDYTVIACNIPHVEGGSDVDVELPDGAGLERAVVAWGEHRYGIPPVTSERFERYDTGGIGDIPAVAEASIPDVDLGGEQ